jgi:phage-related baseplate assembly protein
VIQAAGLKRTELIEPAADIAVDITQASYCIEIVIENGGTDE